jgi:hypothetical protein
MSGTGLDYALWSSSFCRSWASGRGRAVAVPVTCSCPCAAQLCTVRYVRELEARLRWLRLVELVSCRTLAKRVATVTSEHAAPPHRNSSREH